MKNSIARPFVNGMLVAKGDIKMRLERCAQHVRSLKEDRKFEGEGGSYQA